MHDEGMLPEGFKRFMGVSLLIISIGFMSLWGVFA